MRKLTLLRIAPRQFQLLEEFDSESGITVPAGFITDGLSVPIIGRWLVTPTDYGFNAAVVHDFLLKEGYSWKHSNERFYAQLEHDEVPKWRQILYKAGVEAWAKIKG